ncbi:MAG: 3'-5' exonuclease [Holophagaceae bacterium]|nr:3'-5' exonuclease [Holophagaceae bacterium]
MSASEGIPLLAEEAQPLRTLRFAIIDLETTGGSPKAFWDKKERFHPASEITDVGVVKMCGPVIEGGFEMLSAIEGDYPPLIQRLTGITPAMLAEAKPWEQVALRLASELEGRVWVAHHAPFDGSFLKAWLPQGLWHRHRLVCTRMLAKALVPEAKSRALHQLCLLLNIHNRRAHRALPDAEATAELMQHLLARAEDRDLDANAFLALAEVPWGKV